VGDGGGHVPGKQDILEAIKALAAAEAERKNIKIEMMIGCTIVSGTFFCDAGGEE
jgi:hypothetical protein